ncbi:hypothetical protein Tco_0527118 [Tanacetum coccineum]
MAAGTAGLRASRLAIGLGWVSGLVWHNKVRSVAVLQNAAGALELWLNTQGVAFDTRGKAGGSKESDLVVSTSTPIHDTTHTKWTVTRSTLLEMGLIWVSNMLYRSDVRHEAVKCNLAGEAGAKHVTDQYYIPWHVSSLVPLIRRDVVLGIVIYKLDTAVITIT